MNNNLEIINASIHNLKNVYLKVKKNKLIVFTGLSGSGKSSLAFNTIYAEAQRKFLSSLSAYTRQFIKLKKKPVVEKIIGLSPSIAIDQHTANHNPRSTVGTVTEIYDYLRVLFARVGETYCINGHGVINVKTKEQIVNDIVSKFKNNTITILAPIVFNSKGTHKNLIEKLKHDNFIKIKVNDIYYDLDDEINLEKNKKHSIWIFVDKFLLLDNEEGFIRISEAVNMCSKYSNGLIEIINFDTRQKSQYSERHSCLKCDFSIKEVEPKLFSFNSKSGACEKCDGIGIIFQVNNNLLLNKDLSIIEGGILFLKNFLGSNNIIWQELITLVNFYNISKSDPIKNLKSEHLDKILYGSEEPIPIVYKANGSEKKITKFIEGVSCRILRLYKESDSTMAKEYYRSFMSEIKCESCNGQRLNKTAKSILIDKYNICDVCDLSIYHLEKFLKKIKLSSDQKEIVKSLMPELIMRVNFLLNIGVSYLSISRRSDTLSGGEYQRIRLGSQLGTQLTGIIYVLDEPSIGLHQKDNNVLLESLKKIQNLGNTLIVVEHDEDIILGSDYIVDVGPLAGINGGKIIAVDTPQNLIKKNVGLTSKYLSGKLKIEWPIKYRKINWENYIEVVGACENNLKNINVKFPVNCLVCVTGVSGSGKSSLVMDILANKLKFNFGTKVSYIGKHSKINNISSVRNVIIINQQAIGKTSRSNPATYCGVLTEIRNLFAKTQVAKERGYTSGHFSFNSKKGCCEKCKGKGVIKLSMLFMEDIYITCSVCDGKFYKSEILQILYKEKNIYDVLNMNVANAYDFFIKQKKIKNILATLIDVGLDYVKLNQSSPTLSGGESQRVKLAKFLNYKSNIHTLFILDEPTTGMHFHDISKLINVFNKLIGNGDSIVLIEHNLDIIKTSDYIIDLGPGGGTFGGKIIAKGSPTEILKKHTDTSIYLNKKWNLDKFRTTNE